MNGCTFGRLFLASYLTLSSMQKVLVILGRTTNSATYMVEHAFITPSCDIVLLKYQNHVALPESLSRIQSFSLFTILTSCFSRLIISRSFAGVSLSNHFEPISGLLISQRSKPSTEPTTRHPYDNILERGFSSTIRCVIVLSRDSALIVRFSVLSYVQSS